MPKFEIVFKPEFCPRMIDTVEAENEVKAVRVFEKKMQEKMRFIEIKYVTEIKKK